MSELAAQRAAAEAVDQMLSFIEKTSGRTIRFKSIVSMSTGKTENPQDRLVTYLEKFRADAYRAGLAKAAQVVDAKREEIMKDWGNDPDVPEGEHDEADCKGACDVYCTAANTLSIVAAELDRLAKEEN